MNPETKKVLIAMANSLRKSRANVRTKEAEAKEMEKGGFNSDAMLFQARAMLHANVNMYFIAKKAAGITGPKLFRGIM